MSAHSDSMFTAGLVQMRSGLSPHANLDAATALIIEGRDRGADYMLTPEMTNLLEIKRDRLFAAIAPEEADPSLARFRELARELKVFLHVGSLAIKLSPEKAANRSFLIDRGGEIVARYDKIHMFDVDLAGGESYRESRNYRPGEIAVTGFDDIEFASHSTPTLSTVRMPLHETGATAVSLLRACAGPRRAATCVADCLGRPPASGRISTCR